MLKIAIIIGSTRPNRKGEGVARWVADIAKKRSDAEYELVDIKDFNLPVLDEPVPPSAGHYSQQHTKNWAEKIGPFDGFVFVTPEYNHSMPASLKNALDFIYKEWNNKAAAFVSYGAAGGIRAVEALRTVMATLQIADVGTQASFSLRDDFDKDIFRPRDHHEKTVNKLLDELISWGGALKSIRK